MIRFAENLNKMITAGLGGALEAPSTEVAVGHYIRYLESSGAVASFETNIAAPIRSLRVDMQPIQAGSGDPSPDNVRPISGRDSVTVTRTGKNLLPNTGESNTTAGVTWTKNADGTITVSGTATGYSDFEIGYAKVTPDMGTITINGIGGTTNVSWGHLILRDANNKNIVILSAGSASASLTFDISGYPNADNIDVVVKRNNNVAISGVIKPQLELGSIATAYEPYQAQQVTIALGQTVYGGTLDVSTGKLTVTHGEIASYDGEALPGEWISDRDVYAAGTTPTIGAQVVYVLDTPQTIDLDPQQITTLIGENNVWCDAGDVTLEYPYYEETEGY